MSQNPDFVRREFDDLRRVRDELRLQAHLGGMEARDLWNDLEERFDGVEARVKRVANASEEALDDLGDAVGEALTELREGYARLREKLATTAASESIWDRIRHTFERVADESCKATERVVDSFEELGDAARLRVEKARLERDLVRKCAKLGTRVYELSKEPGLPDESSPQLLDDDQIRTLLRDVGSIDAQARKIQRELAEDAS